MGYEILVGLFLMVIVPFVILGFIGFWAMIGRERSHIEDTWRSYALARQREYLPAQGEWPNRSSPSVRWLDDDLELQLFVVGLEAGARTRLVAWPRGKLLGDFVVRQRGRKGEGLAGIHDAAFERAFTVSSRPRGLAARVLDGPARRALLGFWQHDNVVLTYRRGKLILEWPGREANDARLDEAAKVMGELARGVDDAFLRPAAARLANASLCSRQAE
jgi:hypothetical protein